MRFARGFAQRLALRGLSAAALAGLAAGCAAAAPRAAAAPAPVVYLAEGGAVTGAAVRAPGCAAGCQLSGDATMFLWDMTWSRWDAAEAVGTGTVRLNDCSPDCAAGTVHAVRAVVTLSRPVTVCVAGGSRRLWTRASFHWPDGLPSALSGANAPLNPFVFPAIAARAARACGQLDFAPGPAGGGSRAMVTGAAIVRSEVMTP